MRIVSKISFLTVHQFYIFEFYCCQTFYKMFLQTVASSECLKIKEKFDIADYNTHLKTAGMC